MSYNEIIKIDIIILINKVHIFFLKSTIENFKIKRVCFGMLLR